MTTSKIILPTSTFMSVAGILGQTSGGENSGIVLYTTRGEYGEEPGEVPLLAGLAFNGVLASHYYESVEGGEIKPTWWSNAALQSVFAVFGPRSAEVDNHQILIEIDYDTMRVAAYEHDPSDEAPELKLTISTVFDKGFPVEGLRRWFRNDNLMPVLAKDEQPIDSGPSDVQLFEPAKIIAAAKLVKSWKKNLIIDHRGDRSKPAVFRAEGVPCWTGIILPSVPEQAENANSSPEDDLMLDFAIEDVPGYEAPKP